MAIILDGKKFAEARYEKIRQAGIEDHTTGLAIISFGDDPASKVYMRNKIRACEKLGILHIEYNFPTVVSNIPDIVEDATNLIKHCNENDHISGIIIQLPAPSWINIEYFQELIVPWKDVDGFTKNHIFEPCTPAGIMSMLNYYRIPIESKKVCILGRSKIVGRPMARLMLDKNATVTVCHSHTRYKDLVAATKSADIIVSAIGQANFIIPNMLRNDGTQVLVDVGINRDKNNKLCGDISPDCYEGAYAYTPVPGGVGPVTVSQLIYNVVKPVMFR